MFRNVGRLQPSSHLAGMQRVAVPVSITRNDHRSRIGHAIPNLMIGRVLCENREIVWVIRSAELRPPNMAIVEQVVAKHIQHWHHANNRTKQVWPLRQSSAHKQARIRSAKDGKLAPRGSPRLEEPFGPADEVVVGCLTVPSLGAVVPFDSEL